MTVKYHKQNTNFQIENFLMKAAHTPDNMYFQLLELKEDREGALNNYHVVQLRNEAKKARAIAMQKSEHEWERLEAEADLLEIQNAEASTKVLYDACLDEIAFICGKITEIEPLRKYKDKDLVKAHELSQREAWGCELTSRAENFLLLTGTIPPDQFATMRMHPDWKTLILPKIQEMRQLSKENKLELE